MKLRTINISEEGFLKFMAINESRPQDTSRAATFDHILYVYEEQKFRQTHIALRAANEAPTKNPITGHVLNPTIDADKVQTAGAGGKL